jgi:hypothetical protein
VLAGESSPYSSDRITFAAVPRQTLINQDQPFLRCMRQHAR